MAFPPPHITVCSLYIVAVGRLFAAASISVTARGVDRTQDGMIEKKTAAGQENSDIRKIANNS